MRRELAAIAAVVLAVARPARGDTCAHNNEGIPVRVPDGWTQALDDRSLILEDHATHLELIIGLNTCAELRKVITADYVDEADTPLGTGTTWAMRRTTDGTHAACFDVSGDDKQAVVVVRMAKIGDPPSHDDDDQLAQILGNLRNDLLDSHVCDGLLETKTVQRVVAAAASDSSEPGPGGSLQLGVSAGAATDGAPLQGPGLIVAGQARAVLIGTDSRLAMIPELTLGFGTGGGVRYDLAWTLGVGGWLGDRFAIAALTGIGAGGFTGGRLPLAFEWPIEIAVIASVGERWHVVATARGDVVTGADERGDGAGISPIDELTIRADLLHVRREPASHSKWTSGLSVGVIDQEVRGTSIVSVVIGTGNLAAPLD